MQWRKLIVPVSAALMVGGCSTLITATDAVKVAEAIGHIKPSPRDTCETQKMAAEQSSRIDSIIQDKEVVYKAPPCASQPTATPTS